MSTLRISNIEAKSVPASATIDEKVKITNSSGDPLVFIDGKTSGITTVGINTTDPNITFDANSNVVVTGIITATKFSGQFEPTSVGIADSIFHTGDTDTSINFPAADTITAETSGSERLRIDSSGRVLIGTTTEGRVEADDLTIATSGSTGITLRSAAGNAGNLFFSDGTSGDDEQRGIIQYHHLFDEFRFFTNTVKRLTIASNGRLGINTDTPSRLLHINTTGTSTEGLVIKSHDNTYPKLQFGANRSNADQFLGLIIASWDGTDVASIHFESGSDTTNKDDGLISFRTAESGGTREERLRIQANGGLIKTGANINLDNAYIDFSGSISTPQTAASVFRPADNTLAFSTANVERIRVTNGGLDPSTDAVSDLGNSSKRYRDLYLSSGVFLGGTSSSNELHDYEEGTWSPAFKAGNNSTACPTSVSEAKYTKIGRLVTATAYFTMSSYAAGGTGGDTRIVGLPFTNIGDHGSCQINYWTSLKQNITFMAGTVQGSSSEILIRATTAAATGTSNIDFDNTFGPSDSLILTATYHASS